MDACPLVDVVENDMLVMIVLVLIHANKPIHIMCCNRTGSILTLPPTSSTDN
jgi:hypothetical protein